MENINSLRDNIIDKLLTISNKDYLKALYELLNKSTTSTDIVSLSKDQLMLLDMSDEDLKNNAIISQEELDNSDEKWLKEL